MSQVNNDANYLTQGAQISQLNNDSGYIQPKTTPALSQVKLYGWCSGHFLQKCETFSRKGGRPTQKDEENAGTCCRW